MTKDDANNPDHLATDGGSGAEEVEVVRRSPPGTGAGVPPALEPDGGSGAEEVEVVRRSPHGTGAGVPPAPEPDVARWLASEDESTPPPWSALGAIAQLLAAVAAAIALVLALLALAGAASWLFR